MKLRLALLTLNLGFSLTTVSSIFITWVKPGGGGTPLFGLCGDVPLDRVWFFGLAVLNRVYNLTLSVLNRAWYYEPRDFNPDCEQSLSFLSLRPGACEKLKEIAIERRTSDAFLFLICTISTE